MDDEIVPRLLHGKIMTNPIPVVAVPPPPLSPSHAQSEPEPTGMGEAKQGYTDLFIPLSSSESEERNWMPELRHTPIIPKKLDILNGAIIL